MRPTVRREYVGRGKTAQEQARDRAQQLAIVQQRNEDVRKMKLSERASRLTLLKRAAEKRTRRKAVRRDVAYALD